MDRLPGMQRGLTAAKRESIAPMKKMVGPLTPTYYRYVTRYGAEYLVLVALVSFLLGFAMAYYGSLGVEDLRLMLPRVIKSVVHPLDSIL